MSSRRILLIGATGLIGQAVMACAVGYEPVRLAAVARRRVALPQGARMEMFVAGTEHWPEIIESMRPDAVVCALGTTWRKAGRDEDAFRAVDEKLVLDVARATRDADIRQLIVVSSIGADRRSRHLYLRVKGEVEDALQKMRFGRLDILRPGLLRGHRVEDPRPREQLAMWFSPIMDMFLQGGNRRLRSISAKRMAEAILELAQEKAGGRFVHEHDSIMRAARRFERDLADKEVAQGKRAERKLA
ncbi:nucleoside-diphosphate sugar epimerase [Croceicoccus estronivorus]|uniref:NAD(P)H-binding protein n=1 Tax=Croceicoccus estronivorus TaxID=1172626 RepID=UPI00082F436C|nr:NAD(P)H-binding protein [Croceicoccus estronivorus]OCC22699.1 nucleoside-diphosphate sugar epimerase [Croceicoccus estronivorus]